MENARVVCFVTLLMATEVVLTAQAQVGPVTLPGSGPPAGPTSGAGGQVSVLSPLASGEVYPEWWGAVGDGITDDSAALQSAIDYIAGPSP